MEVFIRKHTLSINDEELGLIYKAIQKMTVDLYKKDKDQLRDKYKAMLNQLETPN